MQINPGSSNFMPSQPSHATLTIETVNSETDERTKKRFRCRFEGCPRTYSSAGNLKAHIKSHTGKSMCYCQKQHVSKTFSFYLQQGSILLSVLKKIVERLFSIPIALRSMLEFTPKIAHMAVTLLVVRKTSPHSTV